MPRLLLSALVALLISASALAQSNEDLRRVVLVNGDVYVGVVADENADPVVVTTTDGVERRFPRAQVDFVAPLINGRFFRTDPVKTRFFVAPTARTLGAGEFRGDLTYIFPSVTAGLNDRVDFLASGLVGFADDFFFTPLIGFKGQVYNSGDVQIALGTSVQFSLGGDDAAVSAVPYGVVTLGDETSAVSFGLGGAVGSFGDGVDVANGVIYGLGAERQINNGVKLFVEALGVIEPGETATSTAATKGCIIIPGVRLLRRQASPSTSIGFLSRQTSRASYGFAPDPPRGLSYSVLNPGARLAATGWHARPPANGAELGTRAVGGGARWGLASALRRRP